MGAHPAPGSALPPAPQLVNPTVDVHASFLAALDEYRAEGRHHELPAALLANPDEFARYVRALRGDVSAPGEPERYLAALQGLHVPPPQPCGHVPQTVLWWVAGHDYLGRLAIRHRLTAHLLLEGGNIGYEVRPGARRRGHATAMLAAALPLAAALGIESARIDCDEHNVASRRVIEKNGGLLETAEGGNLYFWVPTSVTEP